MTVSAVGDAFRTRMEALTFVPPLPVVWENDDFNPEADGGERGWIFFEINRTREEQVTFGSTLNIHRDYGVAVANVVVPRGVKVGAIDAIADTLRAHFKSESVSGVHITNRTVGEGRLSTRESRWFVTPFIMEFWADRLETSS